MIPERLADAMDQRRDESKERGRMAEAEADRVCDPGFAFGGAR